MNNLAVLAVLKKVSKQVDRIWDMYDLQYKYAEFEYFGYSGQVYWSIESSNYNTFTVLDNVNLDEFTGMSDAEIYKDLARRVLDTIENFDPEDKYIELVGDEYDDPKEFMASLEDDKSELDLKALIIKLALRIAEDEKQIN